MTVNQSRWRKKEEPRPPRQLPPRVKLAPPEPPKTFKCLPQDTVMPDDFPMHPGYVYIIDGVFEKMVEWADTMTVEQFKKATNKKEVRRASLFGYPNGRLGDKVEI